MILSIAKFIAKWFGVDLQKAQTGVLIGLMILLGAFVLFFVLSVRSCMNKPAKLNQEEIIKAQQAIAAEDRKTMIDTLAKSDAREAEADGDISNAKANTVNAIHESKQTWNAKSDEEIKAELMRRMNQ